MVLPISWFFGAVAAAARGAETSRAICENVTLIGEQSISFSSVETKLICGDPDNPTWRRVPPSQSQYWLRVFLQDRGYFFPRFEQGSDGTLKAELGSLTTVKSVEVHGLPEGVRRVRFRGMRGESLTPQLLDQIEKRYRTYLESSGYACSRVQLKADAPASSLSVELKPEAKVLVRGLKIETVGGLEGSALSRYFAFEPGDVYNGDYLTVSTDRIVTSGLLQSAYFSTLCDHGSASLSLRGIAGPPRVFSVGFGISTDRVASLRANWRNNRIGTRGSQLGFTFEGSQVQQELRAEGDWYAFAHWPRTFLHPELSVQRRNFAQNENYIGNLSFEPTVTWDTAHTGFRFSLGPELRFVHTSRGPGPKASKFVTVAGEFRALDHYYEFFQSDPQQGYRISADLLSAQEHWFSPFSAHRLRIQGEHLWNILNYNPPLLVLGLRGSAATTLTPEVIDQSSALTDEFRHYLGGRSDMRGFSLRQLPGPEGALTSVTASFEVRLTHVLPLRIDPLVFVDAGMLGKRPMMLNRDLYYSPGFGLRWNSPIGAIRTTLARGGRMVWDGERAIGSAPHLQFYFSLGEEF